jgi:hypothetical protein
MNVTKKLVKGNPVKDKNKTAVASFHKAYHTRYKPVYSWVCVWSSRR